MLLYTANYRPEEAGPLAASYGVARVLSKTADPDDLLAAINEALGSSPRPQRTPPGAELAGEHLRMVTAKLVEKVQALDESEVRFATLAELSPVGILVGDAEGLATFASPRLAEITRTSAGQLLGRGWLDFLPPDKRTAPFSRGGSAEGTLRWHGKVTQAAGQGRWLSVAMRHLHDGDRRRVGFMAMVDDVTQLIEAEQQRHAAERERAAQEQRRASERFDSLARLSGGVAHDFNNLLNVMLNFTDFVRGTVRDTLSGQPDAARAVLEDLDQISNAGKRASHLTHQLLTFGARQILQPAVVDVNAIVDEVRAMIGGTIGQHVTIATELDPSLPPTRADASQLSQVLLNLALNARDAMPHGGQLTVSTARADLTRAGAHALSLPDSRYIEITVTDTGSGMPPEVASRAIEPFFTTKPQSRGSGLGLATAYGIVRQSGGELTIDSAPGQGTTIHIYLPATSEPTIVPAQATAPETPASGTVLVAEDEDGVCDLTCRILTSAGYEVLAAANGEEALAIARKHHGAIDILLTDVIMPRMNGAELSSAFRQQWPGTPILYMSGYAAPVMTERGVLGEGVTVISKPFTAAQLLAALQDARAAIPQPPAGR